MPAALAVRRFGFRLIPISIIIFGVLTFVISPFQRIYLVMLSKAAPQSMAFLKNRAVSHYRFETDFKETLDLTSLLPVTATGIHGSEVGTGCGRSGGPAWKHCNPRPGKQAGQLRRDQSATDYLCSVLPPGGSVWPPPTGFAKALTLSRPRHSTVRIAFFFFAANYLSGGFGGLLAAGFISLDKVGMLETWRFVCEPETL